MTAETTPLSPVIVLPTDPKEAGKGGKSQFYNTEFIAGVFLDLPEGAHSAACRVPLRSRTLFQQFRHLHSALDQVSKC